MGVFVRGLTTLVVRKPAPKKESYHAGPRKVAWFYSVAYVITATVLFRAELGEGGGSRNC